MSELISTYWEQFQILFVLIRTVGLGFIKYLLVSMVVFGILRTIYKYAAADSIGKPSDSSWALRIADWVIMIKLCGLKSEFLREQRSANVMMNSDEKIPVGFNPLGVALDVLITGIFCGILLFIWPIVLLIVITFGPVQWCRNRNMRKKEFMAKLKGEEVNV